MQFIGSLGHYFTPAQQNNTRFFQENYTSPIEFTLLICFAKSAPSCGLGLGGGPDRVAGGEEKAADWSISEKYIY